MSRYLKKRISKLKPTTQLKSLMRYLVTHYNLRIVGTLQIFWFQQLRQLGKIIQGDLKREQSEYPDDTDNEQQADI